MKTELLALDLETTVSPTGDPNPWLTENKPYIGSTVNDDGAGQTYTFGFPPAPFVLQEFKVLVGHNLKFDLAYAGRFPHLFSVGSAPLMEYIREHAIVWDTMLADYLVHGQEYKYPSLEESCERWGVPYEKRIDLAEELPKVGYDITKINDLTVYCMEDTQAAMRLAKKQLESPWVKTRMPWMLAMMQALLATCEIESNGMNLDIALLLKKGMELHGKMELIEDDVLAAIAEAHGDIVARHVNLDSSSQMSRVFFGGTVEYVAKEPAGVYASGKKAGQAKFKNVTKELTLYPLVMPHKSVATRKNTTGVWSTATDVLDRIIAGTAGAELTAKAREIATLLKQMRECSKIAGTYVGNLTKHAFLDANGNTLIHPQIGMVDTGTGRTASRKPNMQNNPTNDPVNIRQAFSSRFGALGEMVEIDFKQVEVLALAHLSQDRTLIDDILTGRDIHTETGKGVFGRAMTKTQRRVVKTINFGLIYGGSAQTLAEQAGIAPNLAKRCIDAFYRRYPETRTYFTRYFDEVVEALKTRGVFASYVNGMTVKKVRMDSPTGRMYTYTEQWSDKMHEIQAPYTQTRNYPIQGLATADMVLNIMGVLWRRLLYKYKCRVFMCGLIHDSLVFDCYKEDTDDFIKDASLLMMRAGEELNKVCPDLNWTLPVKVEVSRGDTLGDMVEQH